MSRQHKSRCLHLLKLYVIQCYAPIITLTSSARLRYIITYIRHVSTISRSQMRYFHKVCHEYISIHSDILITFCSHITYCNFISRNNAEMCSHVQHLCMMHAQMRHSHVIARTLSSSGQSIRFRPHHVRKAAG